MKHWIIEDRRRRALARSPVYELMVTAGDDYYTTGVKATYRAPLHYVLGNIADALRPGDVVTTPEGRWVVQRGPQRKTLN